MNRPPQVTQQTLIRSPEEHALTWLYVRIYCQRDENDDVLLRLIAPLEQFLSQQGLICSFFFIRYAEGGPHLRVRFQGPKSQLFDTTRGTINRQITTYFAAQGFTLEGPLNPGPYGLDDLLWHPLDDTGTLKPIPSYEYDRYVPEIERYGGQHGMRVSEYHFAQSSKIVFQILEQERKGAGSRRNAALLLLNAITDAFRFFDRQKTLYFEQQYRYYTTADWYTFQYHTRLVQAYEQQRWALQLLVPPPGQSSIDKSRLVWLPIVERWQEESSEIYRDLLSLWKEERLMVPPEEIMSSYIHMFCNRLGLFPREEAYLSYLLYCTYAERFGMDIHNTFVTTQVAKSPTDV